MIVYIQHFKNSTNPTHRMLHKAMEERGLTLRYFQFFFFPIRPAIIYVHFPDICVSTASVAKMLIKFSAFIFSILFAKLGRSRIVWEVNNIKSHEQRYPLFEAILMAVLTRSVSGVIHYSKSSFRETSKIYPRLKDVACVVIPHPNFRHVYPTRGDVVRGQQILGVKNGETTLLAFGMIRRYKGIEKLIDLFKKIEGTELRLIIAGIPIDKAYADELQRATQSDTRILVIPRVIPHDEVPHIYAAAALHCAPFRAVLNSGSVILALSCACPVIAPRMGSLQDLEEQVGTDWIMLYDGELDVSILHKAIAWSRSNRRHEPQLEFCNIEKVVTDTLTFLAQISSVQSAGNRI